MRKIGWYVVSASVVAFILGCVLLLAANLYVQSQVVQQRIRRALSMALRMPVSVKKTTITPWEGLRIDGLTAHPVSPEPFAKDDSASADYLLASSFRVRFALWPLIARRECVIKEVLLDQPKVAWAQDEDGRWQLPSAPVTPRKKDKSREHPKAASASMPPPDVAPPGSAPAVASAPSPLPPPPVVDAALPTPQFDRHDVPIRSVEKLRLRHGNLAFLNNKRRQVARFEEVDLDGHLSDLDHADGTVGFAKVTLPRVGVTLTKFRSDFTYGQDSGLALNNGHAQLAGGDITANYRLRTDEPASPFTVQCRLDNIGLGQLIHEAGSRVKLLDGRLQGDLRASGLSDDPDSRVATGKIQLVNARVRDVPIFRMLGEMLRIEDLSHMEFKVARLDYRLDGTVLQIDPLVLASNDLRITAQGKYFTDADRLDLHARLAVDEAVSRQLPPSMLQQFQPDADLPGSHSIDFNVTGPVGKPNTNLYKRILAPEVNDLLQSLLSPKQKTPRDKFLKRAAPTVPAEPDAASPVP